MGESPIEMAIEPELRGNTLRVYWYMLTSNESVGVREVQRALNMSSPSVASHHLTKLVSLDLVEQLSDNTYKVKQIVKVGVLQNFIGFRGRFLPRYAFVVMPLLRCSSHHILWHILCSVLLHLQISMIDTLP